MLHMKGTDDFFILDGKSWPVREIESAKVRMEEARWRGKTEPFVHQILSSGTAIPAFALFEPKGYVGIRIEMKDGTVLADYVSEKPVFYNTDGYHRDRKLAESIRDRLLANRDIKLRRDQQTAFKDPGTD